MFYQELHIQYMHKNIPKLIGIWSYSDYLSVMDINEPDLLFTILQTLK